MFGRRRFLIEPLFCLYAPEGDNGGTSDDDGKNTENKEDKKNTSEEKDGENGDSKTPEKKFTQAELDDIIGKRLDEERKRIRKEREDEDKKKQGKFEELYTSLLEKETKEYKPAVARAENLSKVLNSQIDLQIKDWPSEVTAFDPGKEDVEARAAWVEKAIPLAQKLAGVKAPNNDTGNQGGKGKDNSVDRYFDRKYARKDK